MTREEIDAILDNGSMNNTRRYSQGEIDAILDAGNKKQTTAPVSSPKPKANADLLAYAERVSQSAKRDAEKAKINEEKEKREKAIASAKDMVTQSVGKINEQIPSVMETRNPIKDIKYGEWKPGEGVENFSKQNRMYFGKQGLTETEKEAAMQKFAQPGYKLNKEEKKLAREINKEMYKDLDKELRADKVWQKDYQGSADPISRAFVNVAYGGAHSPEGEKLKTMRAVANKTNPYLSYASGLADSLHLDDLTRMQANALLKATGSEERLTDNDVLGLFGLDKEASKTQNPVASGVGNMAGTLTGYMAGSEAMKNIPAVAGVTGKAGGAVGKGAEKGLSAIGFKGAQKAGQAIGQGASNVLGDTMLDVALDTVPNALDDAKSGLSAKEVTTNALKNVGGNLAWNVAGEGLVQGLPKLGKVVGKKKKVATNLPEIEQLGKDLNPLADARKVDDLDLGAVEQTQKQAVDKIEELSEQIPKIADDVPAEKVDDVDELAVFTNPIEVKNSPYDVADFKKYKVNNHDSMSSDIDKIVGMYGDDAAKIKAIELKQSINRVLEENSDEAWEEAIQKATELDNALKGKKYTYKRTNKKHKGYRSETAYEGEIVSLFNMEVDDIAKEALENSAKRTSSVAESSGLRNPELTVDAKKGGSNVPPASGMDSVEPEIKARSYTDETIQKTDLPEELKNEFKENVRTYEVLKNKTTEGSADEIIANNGFDGSYKMFNDMLATKDPVAIPLGYKLSQMASANGNADLAIDIIDNMSKSLTEAGQFTQATVITMLKNDPMASMRYMEKQIQKMNLAGAEKYGKKWTPFKLTDDEVKAFSEITSGDEKAIKELYDNISKRLAKEYPATMWEKVVELSKTAMMLNPRTHMRNVVSNTMMVPVRSLTDRVSAIGQNAVHLFKPDMKVTQSLVGGTRAQKKVADKIFDEQILPKLKGNEKWQDAVKNAPRNRQVFNDSIIGKGSKKATLKVLGFANKNGRLDKLIERVDDSMTDSVLENLRKFDYWLLGDVEDNVFVKENFSNRLASYMKAQKITSIDDVPNEAVQIAYEEALKATFKDDNTLTRMFSNLKRDSGKLGEVVLPFTKTPANIAMRGIDYSPVGMVNAIKQAKSGADVSKVIDTIAKSALGTTGIALGYKLAENGLIQGALSSDADEQQFEKQQGKIAFSLKIGDNYESFDWAQPAAIPIIIGTTIYDALKESDNEVDNVLNSVLQGAMAATDAWADLSPLSSLKDIFGGGAYGSGSIAENFANEIMEFPQRLIPAVSGATARTMDPTIRQTYSKGNPIKTQIDTVKSKIPYLSETLPASYDTWGNEKKRQNSTGAATLANFLNPGSLGYDASTPIDGEIKRLYEATQNKSVFPHKADWSVKDGDGNKIKLDNRQYSEYQKAMGETSYDMAEALITSDFYDSLSDEDKTEHLSDLYGVAKAKANKDLFGTAVADTHKKMLEAYESGGTKGLLEYMKKKHDFASVGLNISQTTQQVYDDGGLPYLKEYNEIKTNANTNGKGLTKDELIPYLDSKYQSDAEKRYWFGIFSTAKNPY